MTAIPYFVGQMPWSSTFAEDKRFRQLVSTFFIASLIFSIVVPLINLPPTVRDLTKKINPETLVKIQLKKPIEKKPEIDLAKQEALRRAEEERQRKLEEELKRLEEERRKKAELDAKKNAELDKKRQEELKKQQELDRKRQEELKKQQQEQNKALQQEKQKELEKQRELERERQRQLDKDRAEKQAKEAERRAEEAARARAEAERTRKETEKRAGAEKARNELAGLSDLFGGANSAPNSAIKGGGTLTKGKDVAGPKDFGSPSVIATTTGELGKGSGGVDTKNLGTVGIGRGGGTALGPRAEASVDNVNFGVVTDGVGSGGGGSGGGGGRGKGSKHSIDLVIEQNKGRISSLYQRLFRRDPTQTGKVAVRITIKPSGEVENVEIVSSAIKDEEFLGKLKSLLKSLNFGNDDSQTASVSVTYPFDFIPEN